MCYSYHFRDEKTKAQKHHTGKSRIRINVCQTKKKKNPYFFLLIPPLLQIQHWLDICGENKDGHNFLTLLFFRIWADYATSLTNRMW